ncbi:YceI family protein [Rapidithrix thailandica]|uniref:YceI family protein n=1 Tax=Rapidithrix thailandica TaxID=413964 RepID=A0AAW9S5Q6_9BACT
MKALQIIGFFAALLSVQLVHAQRTYTFSESTKVVVTGTSTLHDWEAKVDEVSGTAKLDLNQQTLNSIDLLSLKFASESLHSGKDAMDKNIYKALKTGKYPHIQFILKEVKEIRKTGEGKAAVTAKGNLTIAGVTKPIHLTAQAILKQEEVAFRGEYTIDMTQYGIEPPKAMLGTIKTGKDVVFHFDLTFKTLPNGTSGK